MEPVQVLAILSFGAFLIILVTALFYVFTARPRLLESAPLDTTDSRDERLFRELYEQRTLIEQMNRYLVHHAEQLRRAIALMTPSPNTESLEGMLRAQSETVQSLSNLLNEQSGQLSNTARQVETLAAAALPAISAQLHAQGEKLDRLERTLEARAAESPPPPAAPDVLPDLIQAQTARLDSLSARLDELAAARSAPDTLPDLIQAQAERLIGISQRLDEWAAARAQEHAQLAEHARILADLDRQIAAQAQAVGQLDAKVSDQHSLLLTAEVERREQAGVIAQLVEQFGQIFPILRQAIFSQPRAPESAGRDRLIDINGIGPVYSRKLTEAGITTFEQLAAQTPDEIRRIIAPPKWREKSVDAESWIEQARRIVAGRRGETE